MANQSISCPHCKEKIMLDEALSGEIKGQLKSQFEVEFKKREGELLEREKNQAAGLKKKFEEEKVKMWKIAQEKAVEKIDTEMKDLLEANKEKDEKLKVMRDQELELRKQKREIEEKEKNLKLEMERKMDIERKNISEGAKKEAAEEMRLKVAEKDKQLEQLRKSLEDARRKSEQGSMQIQGDVQEDDLKIMLRNSFPIDVIEDVPTGIKGADLIQTVNNSFGQKAGIILWESKNTKAWSKDWVGKLKDDQAIAKADVCVLVSQTLPEGVTDFKFYDGIWICSYQSVMSLVSALRLHLTQLNQVKQSLVGKDEKMEMLYNYLSGNEFQTRIETIVSAFTRMQSDLETEKRSMQRIWNKRDKEITRVIMSTSGMYGDLQGIVGASLPAIESLELPAGEEDVEETAEAGSL